MTVLPFRMYLIESPAGAVFEIAVIDGGGGLRVISSRNGTWSDETEIAWYDLIMPEQKFGDWSFRSIEPREIDVPT